MSESCTSSEIERSVLAETLPYKWLIIRILIYDLRGNRGFESGLLVEDTNQMIHHMGNVKGFSGFPASMVTIGISSFQIDACHFITNNLLSTNHFFFLRVRAWFELKAQGFNWVEHEPFFFLRVRAWFELKAQGFNWVVLRILF